MRDRRVTGALTRLKRFLIRRPYLKMVFGMSALAFVVEIGVHLLLAPRHREALGFFAMSLADASILVVCILPIALILERQRERVQRRNQYLASVVENADDAIFGTTGDGIIRSWNRSAERMFGYSATEMIGVPASLLVPPAEREMIASRIRDRLSLGETLSHLETDHVRKDGTTFPASATISPVRNSLGELTGASVVVRDMTVLSEAQAANERLIRELKEALAEVNVLSGILPICAQCKRIRDNAGQWSEVDVYVRDHSEAEFSHSVCPACAVALYSDYASEDNSR